MPGFVIPKEDVQYSDRAQLEDHVNQLLSPPTPSDSLTNPLGSQPDLTAGVPASESTLPSDQSELSPTGPPAVGTPPTATPGPDGAAIPSATPASLPAGVPMPTATPTARTSQFGLGLSSGDAYAACGPAAAIAFAQTYGRNPSAQEAMQLAKEVGWTADQGMAGVQSEQALLAKLGVPTKLENGVDWSHVANDAQSGNPVIIDTPGHYFYVDGAQNGRFHVGTSGTDLKGGGEWMTPDEMGTRMGAPRAALYADNPTSPAPSVAAQASPQDQLGEHVRALTGGAVDLGQQAATGAQSAMQTVGQGAQDVVSQFNDHVKTVTNGLVDLGSSVPGAPDAITPQKPPQDLSAQDAQNVPSDAISGLASGSPPPGSVPPGGSPAATEPSMWDRLGTGISDVFKNVFGGMAESTGQGLLTSGEVNRGTVDTVGQAVGGVASAAAESTGTGLLTSGAEEQRTAQQFNTAREAISPSIVEPGHPFSIMSELEAKYGSTSDPLNLHIRSRMTPEDQARYDNASLMVAGVEGGGTSGNWEFKNGKWWLRSEPPSAVPARPPAETAPFPPQPVRPNDVYRGGEPPVTPDQPFTRDPQGNIIPTPAQPGDTVVQGLINEAKARGYDTSALEAQLRPPETATGGGGAGKPPVEPPVATWDSEGNQVTGGPPTRSPATVPPVQRAGITPETVQMAHERIDKAYPGDWLKQEPAHAQLDQMLANGAAPDEITRFLAGTVEGKKVSVPSIIRTVRTGSMAGGLSTEGKVALSPIIQTAMRAPVGAITDILKGKPGDIALGLQGGLAGLAEGAADALQTVRYGTTYRAALTGGVHGGYGFMPGIDVMGKNVATRVAGRAALGLVTTHGALADVSAGIGRGAALARGATPEAAAETGQQWALRSGNYGTIGKTVADALEGIKRKNPAMDIAGQILVPFFRVAYNAFTQGVERSPVGLLGTGIDVARGAAGAGPYAKGQVNKAVTPVGNRLANNMFGLGLAAFGFAQASQGNITGENPPPGVPKWSVRVGGLWVPLRTLHPVGESLAQSVILYEAAREGRGDLARIAETAAASYVGHVYDETWLRSVGDIIGAIGDVKTLATTKGSGAARNLQYQATSLAKSFVPQEKLVEQTGNLAQGKTPSGSAWPLPSFQAPSGGRQELQPRSPLQDRVQSGGARPTLQPRTPLQSRP